MEFVPVFDCDSQVGTYAYPTYGSQGARLREVRMYYEFISLECGKCKTTPLHCFSTKHNCVYGFF